MLLTWSDSDVSGCCGWLESGMRLAPRSALSLSLPLLVLKLLERGTDGDQMV